MGSAPKPRRRGSTDDVPEMSTPRRPDQATLLAFLGVAVLGGLNTIAVKVVVAELAPLWSAATRFLAAGALLVALVIVTGRSFPVGRSLAGAVLYGALAFSGSYALLYASLRDTPAGTVAVFLSLVPLETFGLAIALGQERFHVRGLVGASIAAAGVAAVMSDQLQAAVPLEPMLLALGGTLFIAGGGVILKTIPRADPYATNAAAMLTGGTLLLAVSALAGEPWSGPSEPATWPILGYLVVLGSIGLFGLYLFAIRRWTASGVSYATLLMPLVAVPAAAALVGESVTPAFVVGAGIALVGTYVGAFTAGRVAPSTVTSVPDCLPIHDCREMEPAATR